MLGICGFNRLLLLLLCFVIFADSQPKPLTQVGWGTPTTLRPLDFWMFEVPFRRIFRWSANANTHTHTLTHKRHVVTIRWKQDYSPRLQFHSRWGDRTGDRKDPHLKVAWLIHSVIGANKVSIESEGGSIVLEKVTLYYCSLGRNGRNWAVQAWNVPKCG